MDTTNYSQEFDPDAQWPDTVPEVMHADDRRRAAALSHYEVMRLVIDLEERCAYLARLAGLSEEELLAIAERAEEDEAEAAEAAEAQFDGEDPPAS